MTERNIIKTDKLSFEQGSVHDKSEEIIQNWFNENFKDFLGIVICGINFYNWLKNCNKFNYEGSFVEVFDYVTVVKCGVYVLDIPFNKDNFKNNPLLKGVEESFIDYVVSNKPTYERFIDVYFNPFFDDSINKTATIINNKTTEVCLPELGELIKHFDYSTTN